MGTAGNLAAPNFNPYASGSFLGTTSQAPLPFDLSVTQSDVTSWCPWDLQVFPPEMPKNGVYPYPDTNIVRPMFDPCASACAKYSTSAYCCTGPNDGPTKCHPNYYSTAAKGVCPDAYSYAYDDQTSTFITQKGPGFEIVFCPGGRSTRILAAQQTASASSGTSGSFATSRRSANPILDFLAGAGGSAVAMSLAALWMTT